MANYAEGSGGLVGAPSYLGAQGGGSSSQGATNPPGSSSPAGQKLADIIAKTSPPVVDASALSVVPDAAAASNSLAFLASNVATKVASIALLQAIVPRDGALANLTEDGRAGLFAWTAGNFSYPISTDPRGGCYVKANTIAAAFGCWVRLGDWVTTGVRISWFGLTFDVDTAAIQAALTLAANLAFRTVLHGSQALVYDATISVPDGVKLIGNKTGSFTQKSGKNLYDQFVMGNGSEIRDVVIDGNWAGNPDTGPFAGIRVGNSSNCVVRGNVLRNFGGYAVVINAGTNNKIIGNRVSNFYNYGIIAYGTDLDAYNEISDNVVTDVGWGCVSVANSNYCTVQGNTLIGQFFGKPGARQYVNTSVSTVTWVSGPNFSGLRRGNFFVANGGGEWRIVSVDSATQITVDTSSNALPTLSNVQAMTGAGDLLGYVQSSFGRVVGNTLREATTFGSGFSLGQSGAPCSFNTFERNLIVNCGKNGFVASGALAGGGGVTENNSIKDNRFIACGCGAGIGSAERVAIYVQYGAENSVVGLHVSGNEVISFSGDGQTAYWLGTSGNGANGTITVNDNAADYGVANGSVILNGIRSIALDANWGAGAQALNATTDGRSVSFAVLSGTTGRGPGAGITINKTVETSAAAPHPVAKNVSSGEPLLPMWGEQQSVRGVWKAFVYNATPNQSAGYDFLFKD